jgi:flagellar hook-length control protein FliK
MSITPFLPGLPAPVPTDGAPAATDQSGDLGVVFGDALAAALLATVPLPTTPVTPVVEVGGGPAPSIEASGPDAGSRPLTNLSAASREVSRLVAGAPHTSTTDGLVAGAPHTSTTDGLVAGAPHTSTTDGLVAGAPHTSTTDGLVAGAPHTSPTGGLEATGADAGNPGLANLPAASPEVSRLVAGAPPTSTATAPTVERAVVQQVFPEVTRLVASTPTDRPGTHRITLTLQPEQLGEVRVTLVVKDGAVQVRLAGNANDLAGSAAVHRALSTGVPELQRLLERSGATEARVLVRDPFSPTQPTAPHAPVAATGQTSGSTVSADAGRDGASTWDRSSGDPDQRRHRRDVPEPPPLAPAPPATTPTTTPSGHLDRSL